MLRGLAVVAVSLALVAAGCGGGGDTVVEASDAVAGLIASDDCLRLMGAAASAQRALGGAVGTDAGAQAQFLGDFAMRAPRELADEVAVVQGALHGLARGGEVAVDEAAVRAAADTLGAWARSSCPG